MERATPSVSLCMIVRDEEASLAQALESVRPIVEEIVVVDTGSTDRTVEVARTQGATIRHFDWVDDFARARNVSLSLASGDWILILDADEMIAESDHERFRSLLNDRTTCWAFTTRNYSNDPTLSHFQAAHGEYPDRERGSGGYFEGEKVRLFPNDPAIRFEGAIHELVEPAIRRLGAYRIRQTEIPIHHYGHTPEVQRVKSARKAQIYQRAGERQLQEGVSEWHDYFDLALEYSSRKRFEQSLEHFERAAELHPDSPDVLTNMGYALCELERYPQAVRTLEQALRINPQDHEALGNLGVALTRMGDCPRAVQVLTRAVEICPGFVNGYCNLAKALLRMGKVQEATDAYGRALAIYPGYATAQMELASLLVILKDMDRAEPLLLSVLEREPQHAAAWYNLGMVYQAQNRVRDALAAFRRFLPLSRNETLNARVEQICRLLEQQSG